MKEGYYGPIERLTQENTNFRTVLYTGEHSQLVLMCLQPGEEIGLETHPENDQFFRFESGTGKVVVNGTEYTVGDGDAVIVPAGAEHNVTNVSESDLLRMYTLYAPAHHKDGITRVTKAEAEADAPDFDGMTTE